MRSFQFIASGIDVLPVMHAIERKAHLWNDNQVRQRFDGSPHAAVDDILLRFEDISPDVAALPPAEIERALSRAPRIFQPAWAELPEVRPMLSALLARVGAYELARVLITRLRPGEQILAHADTQGEYANLPDIARYHVVLQGRPGSVFNCGNESVCMETGTAWWFDAHQVHSVVNASDDDRIHLLIDARVM